MKAYWQSLDELKPISINTADHEEKKESLNILGGNKILSSRRNFLKLCGFSVTSVAVLASCKKPIEKAIPYLIKPEEITPGKSSYYASSIWDGEQYASVLVKVRDGRPIKIDGNDLSSINKGAASARMQASLLNLYDSKRFHGPSVKGTEASWEAIDKEIIAKLNDYKAQNAPIALVTPTIISASTNRAIKEFITKYPNVSHIPYDTVSHSAVCEAHQEYFGVPHIPSYSFDKANIIVGFNADFLGTYLSPIEFTKQYTSKRALTTSKELSRHIQFESIMSVTGSNADDRYAIEPSEEKVILANLYNALASHSGQAMLQAPKAHTDIEGLASELLQNKGKSLVISGTNDKEIQLLVCTINQLLANYNSTLNIAKPLYLFQGSDVKSKELISNIKSGKTKGLITWNTNPVYDLFDKATNAKVKELDLFITLSNTPNETASAAQFICPDHHYLESWCDYEPVHGKYSLSQPVIHNIYNTRQAQETLLTWSGTTVNYYDYLTETWETNIYSETSSNTSFKAFWTKSIQDGVVEFQKEGLNVKPSNIALQSKIHFSDKSDALVLIPFQTVGIGSGAQANNPWLHEMPDPITKVTWDNFASVSVQYAKENDLALGDVIIINDKLQLPVLIQPGQAIHTIAIAIGYGRTNTGKVADNVGVNVYDILPDKGMGISLYDISIRKTDKTYEFALTQTHHTMEGREIVRQTSLSEYLEDSFAGNHFHKKAQKHNASLYNEIKFDGYHWGMAINLNSCTGCGACTIACQAENNTPVIGREQVKKRRIMHWLRIDRYYIDNPEQPMVVHQPVMCQHCDNAPCENVCPVSATNHSNEGLNQMAYNRCVGTKYCVNNCPYRVRRFNWSKYANNEAFDYNQNDDLAKMVLNPDVVVRERGVVEKCSFCVQRIQETKLTAKLENRAIADGEVKTACAQTCPGNAIVFGDLNDKNSAVSKLFDNDRNYHLLEELHTLPSVGYLTKVRNTQNMNTSNEVVDNEHNHNS